MKFVQFSEDGNITYVQVCDFVPGEPWMQVPEDVGPDTHWIDVGFKAAVPYTDEEMTRKINRPPYRCRWDAATKQYVDIRTDDEKKADARASVIAEIEELEKGQPRVIREALLSGDMSRLQALNDKIIQLRAYL